MNVEKLNLIDKFRYMLSEEQDTLSFEESFYFEDITDESATEITIYVENTNPYLLAFLTLYFKMMYVVDVIFVDNLEDVDINTLNKQTLTLSDIIKPEVSSEDETNNESENNDETSEE